MSCTNKSTDIPSQIMPDTKTQAIPIDTIPSPKEALFHKDWGNGSITEVCEYQQDKRVPMYANLCITNTSFPAEYTEEEIFEKISELNQKELHGVYIYDQENSKIIYRTVNHYKKAIFEEEDKKYSHHLETTDYHSKAITRFSS